MPAAAVIRKVRALSGFIGFKGSVGRRLSVQLVLYTCGSAGAYAYTRTAHGFSASKPVKAVDTTGAGDGFIGSFLWQLHKNGVDRAALPALQADQLNQWLDFSNRFCGYSVQRYGAIDSYPTIDQL